MLVAMLRSSLRLGRDRRINHLDEQVAAWKGQSIPSRERNAAVRVDDELRQLSDVELMQRLRLGEQEALSHLFDRHHRLVLQIASRILRDRTEAEDVMQETFFEIYQLVERFDPDKGTVKNWIVQFTYHKSLNRRRYLALRGAFEDKQIMEFDSSDASSFLSSTSSGSMDLVALVRQGMETLTPKQREVVELACFEGFLLKEIADRTKESLGNVRHHYYRGIAKLRDFVKSRTRRQDRAAIQGGEG